MEQSPDGLALERVMWLGFFPLLGAIALGLAVPAHPDWVGHYLAGFGGSLLAVWLAARAGGGRPWALLVATFACVGLGALAEQTVFALAGFDPIDFGAQSIGAVLAGIGLLEARAGDPAADWPDGQSPLAGNALGRVVIALGAAGLVAGAVFAFA